MTDDHEPDAAAEAFARVEGELALLRRAVEGIAIERAGSAEQPDYSETLAGILKTAAATYQRADALVTAAKEGMVVRQVAERMVAAGGEDRRAVTMAAGELRDAIRAVQGVTVSARRGDEQKRWLLWATLGGIVAGMILWAAFAGIVARAVPASWRWPEKMAARSLAVPLWEGGQRMMRAAAPDAFANIAAGDRIVTANREALEACRKRANRTRKAVRCTINVGADRSRNSTGTK